jgi:2-polyprenyl-3-methyl-5-hydroxy-6-metoxy-1,4-benzoquinol methylase
MSFGFPATLIHGDNLVLDRWPRISRHLTSVRAGSKRLLDVGCGSGAFTIGLALLGYKALGLSWDERNQSVARQRAKMCKTALANFEGLDVRQLDMRTDLNGQFDVVLML